MNRCDAELCPNWTGQGCICEVLDLPRPDLCADPDCDGKGTRHDLPHYQWVPE